MPLDPEIATLLRAQRKDPSFIRPGSAPLTILESRLLHDTDAATFTPHTQRDSVANVSDLSISTPRGPLKARVYRPNCAGPTATLLWLHGGGWVTGSLDTADIAARALCARAGVVVVTVDYALAPEDPWPAAPRDVSAALEWASITLAALGGNDILVIGGDSAGGNIAASVALTHAELLAGQLLIYPVVDLGEPQQRFESRLSNGVGYYVSWADIEWAIDRYIPDPKSRQHPTASPSRSSQLATAPPAVIIAVEFDPLRDENRSYADQLRGAGVSVELIEFPGLVHGAFDMLALSPAADAAMTRVARELRSLAHLASQ